MEKELLEVFESAKRAADAAAKEGGSSEEGRCMDALKQLKNFPVTTKILKVEKVNAIKVDKNGGSKAVKVDKISKEESPASGLKRPLSEASNAPPKLSSMIKCNDALRDKVRDLLAEALSKVSSETDDGHDVIEEVNACDPIRIAVSVESALFEKMGRSNGPQKFKYRSIMFNIKDPNNPDLRRKVLLGEQHCNSLSFRNATAEICKSQVPSEAREKL
ncbi:hypothetical protein Sjap_014385 [Stephania japonica]|uniref:TFIIS central domain-containing protein n=1 Tax=Stephania japonica TaxID=461633 RepID=A0AAP0IZU7_9MAGN